MKKLIILTCLLFVQLVWITFSVKSQTIAGGENHTLFVCNDSTVWASGHNNTGQLGNGTQFSSAYPVQVSGITQAISVSAGFSHSMALKSDGTVWSWGFNFYGQLGDSSTTTRTSPVQVQNLTNVIAIACGNNHSMALRSDGTVWTWGMNIFGQLGDSSLPLADPVLTPLQVPGLSSITAIAAGGNHCLALHSNGTIWAWGSNGFGQIGIGTTSQAVAYPVQVLNITNAAFIGGGKDHSLATKVDGTAWSWGYNNFGQLGDGTTIEKLTPVQMIGLTDIKEIVGAERHTIAVKQDGTFWTCGNNQYGQLGDGTTTSKLYPGLVSGFSHGNGVAIGTNFSLALQNDGTLWSFGYNAYGQMGDSTTADTVIAPIKMITSCTITGPCYEPKSLFSYSGTLLSVSFTNLSSNGKSMSWDFGDGNNDTIENPVHTYLTSGSYNVRLIATNTCGTDTSNQIVTVSCLPISDYSFSVQQLTVDFIDNSIGATSWSWNFGDGNIDTTQNPVHVYTSEGTYNVCLIVSNGCGSDTFCSDVTVTESTPSLINQPNPIAGGAWHSLVLCEDKTIWACGSNMYGQLGDSSIADKSYDPVKVMGLIDVISVSSGLYHSIALKMDGTVWTWGQNSFGQLGIGTSVNSKHPVQVTGIPPISEISGGSNHTLALDKTGHVWAWGQNNGGQIGDSTTDTKYAPVQVHNISDIVSIAAGGNFSMALQDDGKIWTWGANWYGQLGIDTIGFQTNKSTPVQVHGFSDGKAIAAGNAHALSLDSNGEVWVWGANNYGQLGDSTSGMGANKSIPVKLNGLSGVTRISSMSFHNMIIKEDSSVWGFGNGTYGQLGDSVAGNKNYPVKAKGLSAIVAVGGGQYHSLILGNDGIVKGCGFNWHGQLGDSTAVSQLAQLSLPLPCNVVLPCQTPVTSFEYTIEDLVITLTNQSINGYTYLWNFGDSSTSTLENPTHTYDSTGTYSVCLTTYNECNHEVTICKTIEIIFEGVKNENNILRSFEIYPNPVNEWATIELYLYKTATINVTITSLYGNVVKKMSRSFSTGVQNVNIIEPENPINIPSGIYFIKLDIGDSETRVLKMVKVK